MKQNFDFLKLTFYENVHDLSLLAEKLKGLSLNVSEKRGGNLLHYYCTNASKFNANKEEVVEFLVKNAVNINQLEQGGKRQLTPLHKAVLLGDCELCKILIAKGANIDSLDSAGNTPLFTAVMNYRGEDRAIISFLIKHGADVHRENQYGNSPIGMAHTIVNYNLLPFFNL